MRIFKQVDLFRKKVQKSPENSRKVTSQMISCPKVFNLFSPISGIIKRITDVNIYNAKLTQNALHQNSTQTISYALKNYQIDHEDTQDSSLTSNFDCEVIKVTSQKNLNELQINSQDEKYKKSELSFTFCECGTECTNEDKSCLECQLANGTKEMAGFLYIKKNDTQLERFWFQLINKELYCISQK